jgi:hypothetical protein
MAITFATTGKKWLKSQKEYGRPCQENFMITKIDIGCN